MSSSTPNARKPGAQPGNSNAFRHGLYSKYFTEKEMQSLDRNDDTELIVEIALARLHLARLLLQLSNHNGKKSPHIT